MNDELINKTASLRAASIQLTNRHTQEAWSHVQSLTVQGTSVTSIVENIPKKNITAWSQTLIVKPSRADLQLRTKSADQPTAYQCEPGPVEAIVEPELFVVREHQTSDEQARPVEL